MRVHVLKEHSSPFGRGRAKHVGNEFDMPADDAKAYIEAGLLKKAEAAKK